MHRHKPKESYRNCPKPDFCHRDDDLPQTLLFIGMPGMPAMYSKLHCIAVNIHMSHFKPGPYAMFCYRDRARQTSLPRPTDGSESRPDQADQIKIGSTCV